MLVRRLKDCPPFAAGDGTELRELLHADRQPVALRYSLAYAVLPPGMTSAPHRLKTSEVYWLVEGEGTMRIDGEARRLAAGDTVYIPPGAVQCLENTGGGELRFLCIVDPAWRKEDEEILTAAATGERG